MMLRLNVPTKRGVVLNGVLFRKEERKTADAILRRLQEWRDA